MLFNLDGYGLLVNDVNPSLDFWPLLVKNERFIGARVQLIFTNNVYGPFNILQQLRFELSIAELFFKEVENALNVR